MPTNPGLILTHGEELHPLKDVPRRLPTPLRGKAYRTVVRYAVAGTGGGHKLECVRIGGRLYTSAEAVARFVAAMNAAPEERGATVGAGARRGEAADQQLAAVGM